MLAAQLDAKLLPGEQTNSRLGGGGQNRAWRQNDMGSETRSEDVMPVT